MAVQRLHVRSYYIGSFISILFAIVLLALTLVHGKKESFLLLNGDLGSAADALFKYITYFGDAVLWVPMIGYIIWKKRKLYLPAVTATFTIGVMLVQVCKLIIMTDEPRPLNFITDGSYIHTVQGVEAKLVRSFPSSHATTAFSFFLLICLMYGKKWWLIVGGMMACLVGYSRIYLAHHFPLDVAVGIIVAILSVGVAIPFQKWVDRRNLRLNETVEP